MAELLLTNGLGIEKTIKKKLTAHHLETVCIHLTVAGECNFYRFQDDTAIFFVSEVFGSFNNFLR